MTVAEMKSVSKARGLKGYTRLRKTALAAFLASHDPRTCKVLKAQARAAGVKGYSRMRKAELVATVGFAPAECDPLAGRYSGPNAANHLDADGEIVRTLAAMPGTTEHGKAMTAYMGGRPTAAQNRILTVRRIQAIAEIREAARSDRDWSFWNDRYMQEAGQIL